MLKPGKISKGWGFVFVEAVLSGRSYGGLVVGDCFLLRYSVIGSAEFCENSGLNGVME